MIALDRKLLWRGLTLTALVVLLSVTIACGAGETPTAAPAQTATSAAVAAPPTATAPPAPTTAPSAPPTTVPVATATAAPVAIPESVKAAPATKRGGTLRIPGGNPAHYDLHQSATVGNLHPQHNMYDTLIRYNPLDGGRTIIADLAYKWESSSDGKGYTFYLREGVKFHDGAPLTADDVVATFNKIIFPPGGISSVRKGMFQAVDKVEAADPLAVRFVLKEPSAAFVPALGISFNVIVRKQTLDDNKSDLRRVSNYPGTGPFKFVSVTPGEQWKVERNPDYWNKGLPYLDAIQMPVFSSAAATDAAIRTGQLDYSHNVGTDLKKWAESTKTVQTVEHVSFSALDVTFNLGRDPWKDAKVRQAIHLVVDRDAMNDTIRQLSPWDVGYWLRTGGKWAPSVADVKKLRGYGTTTQADIDEAKRLMAEAGYAGGIKKVDLLCRGLAGDKWVDYLCPAVADQLRVLNIDVQIRPTQASQWFEDAQKKNFDFAMGAYTSAIDDPSDPWSNWFATGGGQNNSGYSNPEFDAVVKSLNTTLDEQKRRELVKQGISILERDMPAILHAWEMWRPAWYPYVKGANFDRIGIYTVYRWDTVWFDK